MNSEDKKALETWRGYKVSLQKAKTVPSNEDPSTRKKRIETLLGDFESFAKYYFPEYAKAPFAKFQLRFVKAVLKNRRLFITRAMARDHAKSSTTMMLSLLLAFRGEAKTIVLVSYNESNATDLLKPFKKQLEQNQRLINDFGEQRGFGEWEGRSFTTAAGVSFLALGSGQSPRGTKNEEIRPDLVLVDDFDEDEQCRNPKRMDDAWEWLMKALFPIMSIKGGRFIMVGNIIAGNSLLVRASQISDNHEQVDILTKGEPDQKLIQRLLRQQQANKDKSWAEILSESINWAKAGYTATWHERFDITDCVYMITKLGYRLAQGEYFNNPLSEGKVFKKEWMVFKELPKLRDYAFLIAYLDPGFKKTATSDSKCLVLVGLWKGEYHIVKTYCGKASVEEMVGWCYDMHSYVNGHGGSYSLRMEEVFLQDLLYKDFAAAAKIRNYPLPVQGDKRKKPDKDARITATSGYFERGSVYFNQAEANNHHMGKLHDQYLAFQPPAKSLKDGPDAVEGALHLLEAAISNSTNFTLGKRATNNKRV